MFSTFKQKAILALYIFLVLSIPMGAYLASQRTTIKSKASETVQPKIKISTPSATVKPTATHKSDLLKEIEKLQETEDKEDSELTPAATFGPTLSFKLALEGRPELKQASKVFVGISEAASSTVKYLLTFNVDLPNTGAFQGLSLAGLTVGSKYNAYIKGPAQIATSSAFTMSGGETQLNGGQTIFLITGDLNEDNTVNSADYSIAKAASGANSKSANWNENVDFNKDGLINIIDLGIIIKNMAKTGDSGIWVSPTPATKSGTPTGGYWLWVPK